jgi:hypothetical protein
MDRILREISLKPALHLLKPEYDLIHVPGVELLIPTKDKEIRRQQEQDATAGISSSDNDME